MSEEEIWKPTTLPGYDVSNLGRVRDAQGRILVPHIHWGSLFVHVKRGNGKWSTRSVAYLVARAFLPLSLAKGLEYLDGNRHNVAATNLEWRPKAEIQSLAGCPMRQKLTQEQAEFIRRVYATGVTNQTELGRIFNVHQTTIWALIHGKSWREYFK